MDWSLIYFILRIRLRTERVGKSSTWSVLYLGTARAPDCELQEGMLGTHLQPQSLFLCNVAVADPIVLFTRYNRHSPGLVNPEGLLRLFGA